MAKRPAFQIPGVGVNEVELKIGFPVNGNYFRLYGADNPDALRGGWVLNAVGVDRWHAKAAEPVSQALSVRRHRADIEICFRPA